MPNWRPRIPSLPIWMFVRHNEPKYSIECWCDGWVIMENGHSWGVTFDTMQEAFDTMDGVLKFLGLGRAA